MRMSEFDAEAYDAAKNLFKEALNARKSLPAVKMQLEDAYTVLRSPKMDGMPGSTDGENAVERALVDRIGLISQLKERRDYLEGTIVNAGRVIEDMVRSGDGDGGDEAFLRYYYLQGMSKAKAARKSNYSVAYAQEKDEIAVVHASGAVRRLGLV